MAYTSESPAIIVARKGYSDNYADLGAMDRTAAATYCGTKYGVSSTDFQPCVEHYANGKTGDYAPGTPANGGSGSTLSQIGGFFGGLLSGAVNSYATAKGAGGQQVMVPVSTTPPWLPIVAIGGIGLVAVMLLRRPRRGGGGGGGGAPVSNPARRRRRKHRRNPARRRRSRR